MAANDVLRADGAALASIAVLANDSDPDGDRLTVTIEEAPPVGTATANTDGTVRIDSLPSGFKGVTRFRYRVADPAGLSAVASVAVFVGADPFRVLFVGDANSNGAPEVYLDNFVASPAAISAATEGTLRLTGFVSSENGATVVYRRADSSTSDLSFVRTTAPAQQLRIPLATGTTLVQDAQGNDSYRASPNGQWIVFFAKDGTNIQAPYVLNVSTPTSVSKVNIPGAMYATLARFSRDSKTLYLLASPATDGSNKSLYAVDLGTLNVGMLSAPAAVASADDVSDYAVAPDQSRIVMRANRSGRVGLYFIDTSHLQTEIQVSHSLALTEALLESTVGLPPGLGGSVGGSRVAYTTQTSTSFDTWVADVSATPNPRRVATSGARVIGFRPDDAALLYSRGGQVNEAVIDASTSPQIVGAGGSAWYDSTGNIVLLEQFLPSGGTPATYPALAVTLRGAFGSTTQLGTPVLAASYINVSGFDRAVAIIGEGPTTGAAPTSARLALINAVAPDKLIYLADFRSPLQLTSAAAQVVSN